MTECDPFHVALNDLVRKCLDDGQAWEDIAATLYEAADNMVIDYKPERLRAYGEGEAKTNE